MPKHLRPRSDPEEDNDECRARDAQARLELEADKCPPYYPADFEIPLRNLPKEHEEIVRYWTWYSDTPLCAQLQDWQVFRAGAMARVPELPPRPSRVAGEEARQSQSRDGRVHGV
ncbi:hypothetical protein ACQKWADRAFT_300968 [Trichoderma austrokoningii]